MSESVEQIVGDLKARVANLEKVSGRIEDKLDKAITTLDTAKGGWRMLLLVGTVVAAFAGFVAAIAGAVNHVFGK